MDQEQRRILSLVPEWQELDAVVTALSGGITNQNYRVDLADSSFVLRVGGKGTHLLGIDRARERACSEVAAQVGVGAEVITYHSSENAEVLVTRFISGTNLTSADAARPAVLTRIIEAIQRYHQGPAFPGTFSPFETVRSYQRLALAEGVTFPETLPEVLHLMELIESAIGSDLQPCPCHNDLLASNFIDDGQVIRIIDWEYAGMGDRFFDLGNFAVNQSLNEEQCEDLLQHYFGMVRTPDLAHLHLMRLTSDLRESFWGFLQLGISTLDFDYHEYAYRHLNRFLQNAATPQFTQWLHAIQA